MLHSPTCSVSTQPLYVATCCVHSQFTLSHANVTETPAKSVNRLACFELPAIVSPYAKSRLRYLPPTQAIYRRLQTVFTAGWRSWVGLCRYTMQPQGAQEVGKDSTQNSPRPPCESINRRAKTDNGLFVTPLAARTKGALPPHTSYLQIGKREADRTLAGKVNRGDEIERASSGFALSRRGCKSGLSKGLRDQASPGPHAGRRRSQAGGLRRSDGRRGGKYVW